MRLARTTFLVVILLALTAAPAAAGRPSADAAARAEHTRIVRFWTPERLASARPRDFVRTPSGFQPAAKPPGTPGGPGGGGGGDSSIVTGASWNKGGDVVDGVGKAFFMMGSSAYTCSGSVAEDLRSGYSLVLTAGHCVYNETAGEFATNWIFIPAWGSSPTGFSGTNCSTYSGTAYGCWSAAALVVHSGYASAGGFNHQATVHDFGFAVVGPGGKSGSAQLDATVPDFELGVGSISRGERVYAFGYPAAQKYKGNTLTYCAGNTIEDAWNDDDTWGVGCDMTGGSSGGPWFDSFSEASGSGTLGSLNSYGYSGVKNMYGPKFDSNTQAVFDTANSNGTTSNTIVP